LSEELELSELERKVLAMAYACEEEITLEYAKSKVREASAE
jgi:hypothetical protein